MNGRAPELHVVIPIQGAPKVYVCSESTEDSAALKVDLESRDVEAEVAALLEAAVPHIRSRPPELDE